jgi:FkbM family methyltransferase
MRFDFVEIGTSDFSTEIQRANGRRGLSVEPVLEYFDRLPSPETVVKENAAVSDTDGTMDIYYLPIQTIKEHNLPMWMKGTSRVGEPHPSVLRWFRAHGISESLICIHSVPVLSFSSLCLKHGVTEIDYLKIDTEGHDSIILKSVGETVAAGIIPWPERIKIESNSLTHPDDRKKMWDTLFSAGYRLTKTSTDILGTR